MAAPAIIGAAFAALCVSSYAATAESLDFDRTFNERGEPRQTHYQASYRLGADEHRLEVWRDRALRVKRRTDDAIETVVVRPSGSGEWSMTVLDLKRRIRTDVDRTNLFRIGHFTDWFALAHSLSRPIGAYALTTLRGEAIPRIAPIADCRWYAFSQANHTSNICWSAKQRVALLITDASGAVVWRVTQIDSRPIGEAAFVIDDRGFVRNDANQDIKTD